MLALQVRAQEVKQHLHLPERQQQQLEMRQLLFLGLCLNPLLHP